MNCPVCSAPDCVELADDIDIGVGTQKHIYGYECAHCGEMPVCDSCNGVLVAGIGHRSWCGGLEPRMSARLCLGCGVPVLPLQRFCSRCQHDWL